MQRAALIAALATAVEAAVNSASLKLHDAHPMEKVIKMLQDLSAQAEAEGKSEAVAFDKFSHWCTTSSKTLKGAIAEENTKIESLKNQISGEEKLIAELTKQIAQLEKEINNSNLAADEAKKLREETAGLYSQASEDHKATIQAVKDAIAGLVESGKGGASFLATAAQPKIRQALALVSAVLPVNTPAVQKKALSALLQASPERPEQLAEGDRAAHVLDYDFKSGDIIELLKSLQRRFEEELLAADKAETNSLNSYDLEKQARDAAIAAAEKSKEEKETTKGDTEEALAAHKEELSSTEEDLAADSSTLADTEKDCATKTQEWNERSTIRAGEIEAMTAAIGILSKVTGVRTDAPSNPVPPPSPVEATPASFLQLSADPRQKALNLLRSKAKSMHSKQLARMAQELNAHMDDPFGEVNNMMEKMIYRLQQEQIDEDNHKHWCDQEISQTNTSRTQKEEKIEDLSGKIDTLETSIQKLTMEIEAADDMVSKIVSFMSEATEIRNVGKAENAKSLKDAQEAQTAIANANAVITDFYKESGMVKKEAWESFLQAHAPVELSENPSTWDASYTGVADPKEQPAGIISVLETVASDFARMEAETRAQEAEDQKEYEETMKSSEIEKAERSKESEVKNAERGRQVNKLDATKKQKKHTSDELEAVNQYYKDLGPACYEGDSTYEDRKAARDAEIGALKEAEGILGSAFEESEAEPASLVAKKGGKKFLAPVHKTH
eukprot:TRINITY_DN4_c1_g2_i1.p2 TRINITY_DN4_c1_g2~~TRINITY_DN4_c1_g2_i1.p2  ORF type:complete len:729 (-),score=339.55 TRINITY_DN4_c1_g2_i1:123-2309(-)